MDKIIDTILRQKPLIKVLVLVVILGAIIGLYWQFLYRPVQAEIKAIEPELNQLKAELAAKKEIVKEKDRYIAELEETRAKLYVALKQLPDKSEIPTLLENVSSLGTAAGLQFKLFKPMPEIAKNFYAEIPWTSRLTVNTGMS
jgi:type IV pilus assembly protein PilO